MTMTASALDPKFAKIITLMNSTEHDGERQSCRARAEAVAASCGMTFDEAMATFRNAPPSGIKDIFGGFEDFMERQEPGWKARTTAEKAEKERQRFVRRMEILERYGSKDAALAPCKREQKLQAALMPWIKWAKKPHQRWTYSIDGKGSSYPDDHSAEVVDAVKAAYPLPTTFVGAKAEYEYWEARRKELEDVLGPGEYGDTGLDRPADLRFELVRRLYERDLPVTNLTDLLARFVFYRNWEINSVDVEDALIRDLEAIVRDQGDPSNPSTGSKGRHSVPTLWDHLSDLSATAKSVHNPLQKGPCNLRIPADHLSASGHGVADMLRVDPSRSDRHVARACGCSPTTVGKIRRQLGLAQEVRSVQRRGQMYRMKITPAEKGGAECTTSP